MKKLSDEDLALIKTISVNGTTETVSGLLDRRTESLVREIGTQKYRYYCQRQLEVTFGDRIAELMILLIIIDMIEGTGTAAAYLDKPSPLEDPVSEEEIVSLFLGHMTGFTAIVLNPKSYTDNSFLVRYIKVEKRLYISQCVEQLMSELLGICQIIHIDADAEVHRRISEIKTDMQQEEGGQT